MSFSGLRLTSSSGLSQGFGSAKKKKTTSVGGPTALISWHDFNDRGSVPLQQEYKSGGDKTTLIAVPLMPQPCELPHGGCCSTAERMPTCRANSARCQRGKNWQTAERFRPDGQISCPEISSGLLCTQLWNESPP